jgi:probable rRNA maturation factor
MQAPLEVAFVVNSDGWPDGLDAIADTAIHEALTQSKAKIAGVAEVTVVLTDDAEQQDLNKQWRGFDKSTNVLSFPQLEPFTPVLGLVGDITLAHETVEKEAAEMGITLQAHFTHLVVHGFLHLLGYDHIEEADAVKMESLETKILATLGIADPYADS